MAYIGIPIAGNITTDGTASLETIPVETFVWGAAHVDISGGMSLAVFRNAFDLSENAMDASASLSVSMTTDAGKAAAFQEALWNLLKGDAKLSKDVSEQAGYQRLLTVGASTLEEYLESWAQKQIDEDLANNNIPAEVEAEHVHDLALENFAEDASQGVMDLWDDMKDANHTAALNIIARQFSAARYQEVDGSDNFAGTLPVKAGDRIAFRFYVDQAYYIVSEAKTGASSGQGNVAGAAGVGPTGNEGTAGVGAYPGNATFMSSVAGANGSFGLGYGVEKRSVNLYVYLTE